VNNLEKEFVTYDLALRLKVLGFEESCLAYYESQDKNLVINYNNLPLTEEQKKKPGLYTIDNRNGVLPQWAVAGPTWQATFKWFRDKHDLHSWTMLHNGYIDEDFNITYKIIDVEGNWYYCDKFFERTKTGFNGLYKTYEEAEQSCLKKLIEIVESKSK
jgi:hypothetical protein